MTQQRSRPPGKRTIATPGPRSCPGTYEKASRVSSASRDGKVTAHGALVRPDIVDASTSSPTPSPSTGPSASAQILNQGMSPGGENSHHPILGPGLSSGVSNSSLPHTNSHTAGKKDHQPYQHHPQTHLSAGCMAGNMADDHFYSDEDYLRMEYKGDSEKDANDAFNEFINYPETESSSGPYHPDMDKTYDQQDEAFDQLQQPTNLPSFQYDGSADEPRQTTEYKSCSLFTSDREPALRRAGQRVTLGEYMQRMTTRGNQGTQAAATSTSLSNRGNQRNQPTATPTTLGNRGSQSNQAAANSTSLTTANLHKATMAINKNTGAGFVVTRNSHGHSVTLDLNKIAATSPNMADDLADWLQLTQWHNIDFRKHELTRHRQLQEIEAEEAKIEAKKQQLLATSYMYKPVHADTQVTPQMRDSQMRDSHMRDGLPGPEAYYNSPTPQHCPTPTRSISKPADDHWNNDADGGFYGADARENTSALMQDDEYSYDDPQETKPRPGRTQATRSVRDRDRSASPRRSRDESVDSRRNYSYRNRGDCRRDGERPGLSHAAQRSLASRITRPDAYTERREYRDERSGRASPQRRERDEPPKRDFPRERRYRGFAKKIDLGNHRDTRFFIMKCYNFCNVYDSMDEGLWATQPQNEEMLSKAFTECKNVILFFSTNKSHAFQGYARMTSLPSVATARPRWWASINWKISEPFEVEWLSKMAVDDVHVRHIANPLNDGLSVTRGRDGQEIDADAGRELVFLMNNRAAIDMKDGERFRARR
ncbi:Uu.00g130730.m01.CDS01 [Anthostomella pinea]|uniref:Uu.00g130730.m01.CDS01 n=1 Tax=Anthostomella pinea TaxID=933095 RepID=A0AAI8VJV4_9PEZI|nr:Uu.00g130730.m01.CDS01 [Anthostomella pinea]